MRVECKELPATSYLNCVVPDSLGCRQCEQEFVWDQDQRTCRALVEAEKVVNCLFYQISVDAVVSCASCAIGFRLFETRCINFLKIENCVNYLDESHCEVCENGFKPTGTSERCEEVTDEVINCAIYGANGECLACVQGYYVDKVTENEVEVQVCSAFIDDNCAEPLTATECDTCDVNYVKDPTTNKCVLLDVEDRVPGCQYYTGPGNC